MSIFKLKVLGKERGLHVGIGFLGEFQKDNDITLNEMTYDLVNFPFDSAPRMMFHSLEYYSKKKDKHEIEFNFETFLEWIDENKEGRPALMKYIKELGDSLTDMVDDNSGEDSKKK